MNLKKITLVLITASLSGCSALKKGFFEETDYAYTKTRSSDGLKVPEGKANPSLNSDYVIPPIGDKAPKEEVGKNLELLSPSLIIPLAGGSQLVEGNNSAIIRFAKGNENDKVKDRIWRQIYAYFERYGLKIEQGYKDTGEVHSDWIATDSMRVKDGSEQEKGWIASLLTSDDSQTKVANKFKLTIDEHYSAQFLALRAELKGYRSDGKEYQTSELSQVQKRRHEVEFLNSFIEYMEYTERLERRLAQEAEKAGVKMRMGFNKNGQPAFIVEADYEKTWARLPVAFPNLGFVVKDKDKSGGLYFVSYEEPSVSFWGKMFGDEKVRGLGIKEDKYKFQLGDLGKNTSITILDEENQSVPASVMTDIFKPLSQLMADDNLN